MTDNDDDTGIPPQKEREMHELFDIHDSGPERARAALWTRVLILSGIAFAVVIAVLQLTTTLLVRQTQIDNTERAKETQATGEVVKRIADRIEDCTTPGKACKAAGEKATAKAVGDIGQVTVLAAACAIGVDGTLPVARRQVIIQKCILRRLAVDNRR